MIADNLLPCFSKSSAAIVLTICYIVEHPIFITLLFFKQLFILSCIELGQYWCSGWRHYQGADSIKRCHLTRIGNPIVEIRWSYDHLISTMGFPILVRRHLYIESGPMSLAAMVLNMCYFCRVSSTQLVIFFNQLLILSSLPILASPNHLTHAAKRSAPPTRKAHQGPVSI